MKKILYAVYYVVLGLLVAGVIGGTVAVTNNMKKSLSMIGKTNTSSEIYSLEEGSGSENQTDYSSSEEKPISSSEEISETPSSSEAQSSSEEQFSSEGASSSEEPGSSEDPGSSEPFSSSEEEPSVRQPEATIEGVDYYNKTVHQLVTMAIPFSNDTTRYPSKNYDLFTGELLQINSNGDDGYYRNDAGYQDAWGGGNDFCRSFFFPIFTVSCKRDEGTYYWSLYVGGEYWGMVYQSNASFPTNPGASFVSRNLNVNPSIANLTNFSDACDEGGNFKPEYTNCCYRNGIREAYAVISNDRTVLTVYYNLLTD